MYNKKQIYEKNIAPLVKQVIRQCNDQKIPVFMAFGLAEDENGKFDIAAESNTKEKSQMKTEAIIPELLEIRHNDPRFARFINVVNGFYTTINKPDVVEITGEESVPSLDDF